VGRLNLDASDEGMMMIGVVVDTTFDRVIWLPVSTNDPVLCYNE